MIRSNTSAGTVSGGLTVMTTQLELETFITSRGFRPTLENYPNCFDQQSRDNSGFARIVIEERAGFDVYRFNRNGVMEWEIRGVKYTCLPRMMVEHIINDTAGSLA